MSAAVFKRSRDTSLDIERAFAKRVNLGLGDEIPREIRWTPWAAAHFPPRNNHNVPYYKTETVLANAPQIEQFIHKLEGQLPYLEDPMDLQRVVLTKSGRCSKCNCYFVGKGGATLRDACVVKCYCCQSELEAFCCVQCRVLQWLISGCVTGNSSTVLCEVGTRPHQGFAPCPKRSCVCATQTLDDFYKVRVVVAIAHKNLEQGCN